MHKLLSSIHKFVQFYYKYIQQPASGDGEDTVLGRDARETDRFVAGQDMPTRN